jgi:V/A-type H+-transporting ATPase subunit I
MPAGNEADPSVLLALVVPLMFGYMFGDVGQGVIIAAVGFALRRRFALARLFIAGGLAATAFGFVFGSVFSLHVLPPLWVEPLADPLAVLAAPLVGGAFLLIAGLALAALQAHWRGELAGWAAADAGYVLSYVGLVAAPLMAMVAPPAIPAALAAAALGAAWFCAGRVGRALIQARQDPAHRAQTAPAAASNAAATTATTATATTASATTAGITAALTAGFAAVGELVERLLQVLLNTLSFARVGAFALAHAGLSSALLALTQAAPHPLIAALVVVLGNAIVVLLEGLVVSIQTTRLVLFEFFARFLAGQGRVFRPLPPPPSTHELAPPDAAAMAGAARVAGVAAVAGAA